ncbi:peptide-methionine (S)-S-oxide reductase MsrA [Novosphingobium colocasiae]|uniref:Peptide methionine sulfoxide reductase MsrA n=1 Tax=Novosphingobium colocasiae TaxID=1256513 RepID=A0A918UE81_9SPHN|nr:peptide-methionine (S)-S-oxide reductase MsrA [Novosphingobium colocasiae]GGY94758.1 peptide methionine sulfoxide reductase MsrA [Novosphingobium colocasiae]
MERPVSRIRPFLLAAAISGSLAAGGVMLLSDPAPLIAAPPAAITLPEPPAEKPATGDQVAVLAGGCFWGMEGLFEHVKGVKTVTSGYAGGTAETANYPAVSSEKTGHAEAVRIVYDPAQIRYGTLLKVFFAAAHDPTQVNRQYPDTGPSYRSAIFPQNAAQKAVATTYIAAIDKAGAFAKPVATRIETGAFYPAEAYHQNFMRRNPDHGYIVRWDKPKLAAFKARFAGLYRN